MLRLTVAFLLLGGGFTLSGISGISNLYVSPSSTLLNWVIVIGGSSLEAAGYFFLAFSHMMNIRGFSKIAAIPTFALLTVVPATALKAVGIYFLMYGIIETTIAYVRAKKFETLALALGLVLIASAEFMGWVSFLYPTETIILVTSLVIRVLGFTILFIPVAKFVSLGGKIS